VNEIDTIDFELEVIKKKQQKLTEKYMDDTDGWNCFYCGSDNIERDFGFYEGSGKHKCTTTCHACGRSWFETWKLIVLETEEIQKEYDEWFKKQDEIN